jgi:sugar phosphate permease
MAIWIMSGNVGSIFASNICNILEKYNFAWTANFFMTGMVGITVATLIFYFLADMPTKSITNAPQSL